MLIFSVAGCRVEVRFPFLACVTGLLLLDGSGILPGVLFCIVVHEGCHLACMALVKGKLRRVVCTGFGIELVRDRMTSYRREALVSLAGPVGNILLFFLLQLCHFPQIALCSLLLGSIHLLPICPLDGGMALQSILLHFLPREKAYRGSRLLSFLLFLPLSVLGVLLFLQESGNITLLLLCGYVFLYLGTQPAGKE